MKEPEDYDAEHLVFQTSENERSWLKDALMGRLKTDYQWKEYGKELQEECAGRLALTDLGNRLVLIQSSCETRTEEVVKGFDE